MVGWINYNMCVQVSREYLAKAAETLPGSTPCGVNGIPVGKHVRCSSEPKWKKTMSSSQMVYHFCTWQGWRAGPALASSVRLQRWGGAEEEENERRCHKTAKKTPRKLVFYPTWVLTWILAVPQNCEKDPKSSCFYPIWVLTWILAVPPADTMSLWSEEECRAFETGLRFENI